MVWKEVLWDVKIKKRMGYPLIKHASQEVGMNADQV